MEMTRINATELRIRTRDIIEQARFRGMRFTVHSFGKPVAVILGIEEYNALCRSASANSAKRGGPRRAPEPAASHPAEPG